MLQGQIVRNRFQMELPGWEFGSANPKTNIEGPEVTGILPSWNTERFKLVLEVEGHPEYNSTYTFLYTIK